MKAREMLCVSQVVEVSYFRKAGGGLVDVVLNGEGVAKRSRTKTNDAKGVADPGSKDI